MSTTGVEITRVYLMQHPHNHFTDERADEHGGHGHADACEGGE